MAADRTQTINPSAAAFSQAPTKGESYWDLVMRQFGKNRLAVVSFYFILMLSLTAIAAPFLAGNIPIVLTGSFRGAYRDRFEEWKLGGHPELVASVSSWGESRSQEEVAAFPRHLTTIERQLDFLASQLESTQANTLRGYEKEYATIFEDIRKREHAASADELKKLEAIFQSVSQTFDPQKVHLANRTYWPVITQLTWMDFFFMTIAVMTLLSLLLVPRLRGFFPATWREGIRPYVLLVTIPTLLMSIYGMARSTPLDITDYKQDLFNGRIESTTALFPPVQYGINEAHLGDKYQGPSSRYWMGTDGNGRDLLTRMIWGARISLSVGFVAVGIYVAIGIIVGTLAGYFRGWVDLALSRLTEIFICFPAFFLILAVLAFLQPSIFNIMIVIGITGWPSEARLVRGEFLRLNDQEFVLAAKALGVSDYRIIFRHILPNGLAPLLVSASFGIASAILIESSLSFLGFGISIPIPSWGGILNEARENFRYWWITMYPGIAIFATVTAYNLLGEGVRDAMDPRLKP